MNLTREEKWQLLNNRYYALTAAENNNAFGIQTPSDINLDAALKEADQLWQELKAELSEGVKKYNLVNCCSQGKDKCDT